MKAFSTALLLALTVSWIPIEAQTDNHLLVRGRIFQEGKKSEAATVTVYNSNEVYRTITTPKNGAYTVALPLGFYFTMEVKKNGFLPIYLVFDTRTDAQINLLEGYICDVDLLDLDWFGGADMGNLDFPMAIIVYQGDGYFDYTEEYAMAMYEEYEATLTNALNSTSAQLSCR